MVQETNGQQAVAGCCWHIASGKFLVGDREAYQQLCCWHGHARAVYGGIAEFGHGRFVEYPHARRLLLPPVEKN